jgi:hypothetical protein
MTVITNVGGYLPYHSGWCSSNARDLYTGGASSNTGQAADYPN